LNRILSTREPPSRDAGAQPAPAHEGTLTPVVHSLESLTRLIDCDQLLVLALEVKLAR